MSTVAIHEQGYHAGQRMSARGRVVAALVVGGLHLGGFAILLIARSVAPPPEPVVMQVRMITEAPVVMIEPPPPPPEPPKIEKPKPQPRLVATAKPTPSAMVTPPEDEPVTEAVAEAPTPPAPPTAPASSAPAEPQIVPPNFVAAYLNNPAPVYPYAAKSRRESGTVLLRVLVTVDGTAGDVKIEKSSGSSSLDQAALDVVFKRWRFVPAKRGDQPVEAWVLVPIMFELKT